MEHGKLQVDSLPRKYHMFLLPAILEDVPKVVPKFHPSVHKSSKQFGYSFAFDAPTLWNALPDNIRAAPSLATFRNRLKTYLYNKAYPP